MASKTKRVVERIVYLPEKGAPSLFGLIIKLLIIVLLLLCLAIVGYIGYIFYTVTHAAMTATPNDIFTGLVKQATGA